MSLVKSSLTQLEAKECPFAASPIVMGVIIIALLLFSAVDKFKKQFAYLEERYGNGVAAAPPERQQASSLPRYTA